MVVKCFLTILVMILALLIVVAVNINPNVYSVFSVWDSRIIAKSQSIHQPPYPSPPPSGRNEKVTETRHRHRRSSSWVTGGHHLPTPSIPTAQAGKKEESLNSSVGLQKRYSNLERLEAGLMRARATIREQGGGGARNGAPHVKQDPDDYVASGPMYWNPRAFQRW